MPIQKSTYKEQEPRQTIAKTWTELEKNIEAQPGVFYRNDVLCLEDIRTIRMKENNFEIHVLAELTSEAKCSNCKSVSKAKKYGKTEPHMINDLPIRGKRVSIYYQAQRYLCFGCGNTFQQYFAEHSNQHRLTKRLIAYIEKKSLSIHNTFTEISLDTGVRENLIRNIFTKRAKQLYEERKIFVPRWISVDEVFPTSRRHRRFVISDPVNARILDILGEDSRKEIEKWFKQVENPGDIEIVSMDMDSAYKSAIRKALPKAEIVADRYHAQKLVNNCVRETFQIISLSLTTSERKERLKSLYLLLKSRHHLKEEEIAVTKKWFSEFPDLGRAYLLKEYFADTLQLSDLDTAKKRFSIWLKEVEAFNAYFSEKHKKQIRPPRKQPFANILESMGKDWSIQILNYIKYKNEFSIKVTNAFAENANNQIKKGYRKGNGYHFEVLRYKLIFGEFIKDKFSAHPLKLKNKRKETKKHRKGEPISTNANTNILTRTRELKDFFLMEEVKNNPLNNPGYRSRMAHMLVDKPYQDQYDPPRYPKSVEMQREFPDKDIKRSDVSAFSKFKKPKSKICQLPLFDSSLKIEPAEPKTTVTEQSSSNPLLPFA